jgi:hypothetical protein
MPDTAKVYVQSNGTNDVVLFYLSDCSLISFANEGRGCQKNSEFTRTKANAGVKS